MKWSSVRLVAAIAVITGAFLVLGAGGAFGFSCSSAAGVVTLSMNNETVTLAKGNLSRITANGVDCGETTSSGGRN
jgi:hypothetical protein